VCSDLESETCAASTFPEDFFFPCLVIADAPNRELGVLAFQRRPQQSFQLTVVTITKRSLRVRTVVAPRAVLQSAEHRVGAVDVILLETHYTVISDFAWQ